MAIGNNFSSRQNVILKIAEKTLDFKNPQNGKIDMQYGVNSFNDKVMREKLPKDVYEKLRETIQNGTKLDISIAKTVAHAMKEWAIEKGVTHFTHWFQPLTGLTAEKHDAFLEVDDDGVVVERFRADQLVQGEPDASSFPSGGRRTTFEARGYTAWDPSSPAFIMEGPKGGILCIPSIFISYNGEALDKKTPLLRSMDVINHSATKVLKLFSKKKNPRVITTIGTEQEYFLIDKGFYNLRPDLQITGRTLCGAKPAKGQQLDDHYFGSIKERVLGFMQEVETELYKLAIPAKTRHNEVAPHQYEIAPIYAEANIGADRNQLTMELLKKVAARKGLALLLHEKPFAGINGSGKHNNWSLEDSEKNNLLDPGETPEQNLQFLVFLVATLRAVHQYGGLLRASVATAGNDHRLGANEAPPAIISVFLGSMLDSVLNNIKGGKNKKNVEEFVINLGIDKLPAIIKHNTDRNRTSPFAFTGSKFEFRALGSADSVSFSNTILNGGVAESIELIVKDIQTLIDSGKSTNQATLETLKKYIIETEPVRYEGNNYSDEWKEEAARRGLPILNRAGYALNALITSSNKKMLIEQGIFSEEEIESLYHTKLEQYVMQLEIEAETFIDMLSTIILPVGFKYQQELVKSVKNMKNIADIIEESTMETQILILKKVNNYINEIGTGIEVLNKKLREGLNIGELSAQAKYFSENIVDILEQVRQPVDKMEKIVPDEQWSLPKYSEMLTIL